MDIAIWIVAVCWVLSVGLIYISVKEHDRTNLTLTAIKQQIAKIVEEKDKHGYWISIWSREDPDISTEGRCSYCRTISNRPLGEYCKHCGAKMDEKESNVYRHIKPTDKKEFE